MVYALFVASLLVLVVAVLVVRAVVRTAAAFVSERRALRAAPAELAYPADRDGWSALREAGTLLAGAESGLVEALQRARWELLGFGDPDARQYALNAACGDLLHAQRAIRHGAGRLHLAVDPGDDVPLVEDPLKALAARGAWTAWVALMLLPAAVRGGYRYLALRRQVLPLLEAARDLQDVVATVRRTAEPAPPRLAPVHLRALATAG